jgi:hypothetical protein
MRRLPRGASERAAPAAPAAHRSLHTGIHAATAGQAVVRIGDASEDAFDGVAAADGKRASRPADCPGEGLVRGPRTERTTSGQAGHASGLSGIVTRAVRGRAGASTPPRHAVTSNANTAAEAITASSWRPP